VLPWFKQDIKQNNSVNLDFLQRQRFHENHQHLSDFYRTLSVFLV